METLIQLLLSKQELQQPKQQKKAKVTVPDKKQMLPINITTRIEISSHCSAKRYYKKRSTPNSQSFLDEICLKYSNFKRQFLSPFSQENQLAP